MEAAKRRAAKKAGVDPEAEVRAAIAAMPAPYNSMGERLHNIIRANGPVLTPRTWYGMPAYAKDGKVICFFRAHKIYDLRPKRQGEPRSRGGRAAPAPRIGVVLLYLG